MDFLRSFLEFIREMVSNYRVYAGGFYGLVGEVLRFCVWYRASFLVIFYGRCL